AAAAGPCIALDHFDQPFHAIAFGFAAHAQVGALAVAYARDEATLRQRAFDHEVHHVVGNDPLLGAIDALDRTVAAHDVHAVVFARTFGEDELHARIIPGRAQSAC